MGVRGAVPMTTFGKTSAPAKTRTRMGICSATAMSLIADPRVMSLLPAWPHTFVEIDHEIFSMVIQEGSLSVTMRVSA